MKRSILLLWILLLPLSFARSQWSQFAPGNTNGTVVDFEIYNDELYAAGLFTQINGSNSNSISRWNGSSWQSVAGGFPDGVHNMTVIDDKLYTAVYEMQNDSNWIYYLSGGNWQKLGKGFYLNGASPSQFYTCSMYDVQKYNNEIYASGEFNKNGTQVIKGIAKYNGTDWQGLGSGLSIPFQGQVIYPHQILINNGKLYVCGNFKNAGGVTVNGIAVWDGSTWSALGTGFNSVVYAIEFYNNELYAGGDFTLTGTDSVNAIAKWNGSTWVSPGFKLKYIGNANGGYLFVHTLKVIDNELLVAGGFDRVKPDGQPEGGAGNIISFDGNSIDTLKGGANNDVEGLIKYKQKILIGGFFSKVGANVTASKIALYDYSAAYVNNISSVSGSEINVYPNPFKTEFSISGYPERSEYKVYDILGRMVLSGKLLGSKMKIDNLLKGMYFLIIEKDGIQVKNYSILKQQ